LANSKRVW